MTIRPIICAAVALVLALAGCAGGVGQQSASLEEELHRHAPSEFKASWQEYHSAPFPDLFALSRDGTSFGYVYCPAPTRCPDSGSASYDAITYCEAGNSADCDIYAQGRRIVWLHAFPWVVTPGVMYDHRQAIGATGRWHGLGDALTFVPEAAKPEPRRDAAQQRTFSLSYVGSAVVHAGTLEIKQGERSGRTHFFVDGQECGGRFWFTSAQRGGWQVNCDDGSLTASGNFTATGGPRGGSRGTGVDNQGRMVEFVVDPAS